MPFSFVERMTTAGEEFEAWLKEKRQVEGQGEAYEMLVMEGLKKLEELNKKYNVTSSKT